MSYCWDVREWKCVSVNFLFIIIFLNLINMKEFNRIIKVNLYKQFMIIYDHLSHKRVLLVSCTTNKNIFWCSKYVKILRKFIIIDFFPPFFSVSITIKKEAKKFHWVTIKSIIINLFESRVVLYLTLFCTCI